MMKTVKAFVAVAMLIATPSLSVAQSYSCSTDMFGTTRCSDGTTCTALGY